MRARWRWLAGPVFLWLGFSLIGVAVEPRKPAGKSATDTKAATLAAPQPERPAPAFRTLLLARDPAVHRELQLNAGQLKLIGKAVAAVDQPLWVLRDVPVDKCAAELDKHLAQLQAALAKVLDAEQLARFDQLVMQSRGARALSAPDVAARLKLTAEQSDQVHKLIEGTQADKLDSQRVLELLQEPQQAELSKLFGRTFDLSQLSQIGCLAPELRGVDAWINSPGVSLAELRGKVLVVHFWAFNCSNCVHNLPHYQAWYEKFPKSQLTIIGIHTPETSAERNVDALRSNVGERAIEYPVAVDAKAENWKAWGNNLWPSVYLIDKRGQVRGWWYGELNWQGAKGEQAMRERIAQLIAEK